MDGGGKDGPRKLPDVQNGKPLPERSRPITCVSCTFGEVGYTGKTEGERTDRQTSSWGMVGQRQLLSHVRWQTGQLSDKGS